MVPNYDNNTGNSQEFGNLTLGDAEFLCGYALVASFLIFGRAIASSVFFLQLAIAWFS
jgi:hypothetical protein